MKDPQIKKICCGANHSFIFKKNGDLFVFGHYRSGRLGLGDITSNQLIPILLMNDKEICEISCGFKYNLILFVSLFFYLNFF